MESNPPGKATTDVTMPSGVGNVAAQAVHFRHRDGANQLGDEPGGAPGIPYSDYTGYASSNKPMDLRANFDPAAVYDPNRWQPLRYIDVTGALVTQPFVAAQWRHVTPFRLSSAAQLRSSTGPARNGSHDFLSQARAPLEISAGLTDEQTMIAEYSAEGAAREASTDAVHESESDRTAFPMEDQPGAWAPRKARLSNVTSSTGRAGPLQGASARCGQGRCGDRRESSTG